MLMDEWLWLPSCSYRPSLTHKACSLYSYPDSYNTRSENFQESRTYRYDCFKFKCVMCYWLTIKVFFRSLIFFIWNLIAQVHRKIYLKYHFMILAQIQALYIRGVKLNLPQSKFWNSWHHKNDKNGERRPSAKSS